MHAVFSVQVHVDKHVQAAAGKHVATDVRLAVRDVVNPYVKMIALWDARVNALMGVLAVARVVVLEHAAATAVMDVAVAATGLLEYSDVQY